MKKSTTTATATKAVKKATKKAATKPVKKATKPATKTAKKADKPTPEPKPEPTGGMGKVQVAALQALAKNGKPMSRSALSEALDGVFIGGRIMGHVDPAKLRATSLVGRGLVTIATPEDGPATYSLTAAGRKIAKGGE